MTNYFNEQRWFCEYDIFLLHIRLFLCTYLSRYYKAMFTKNYNYIFEIVV